MVFGFSIFFVSHEIPDKPEPPPLTGTYTATAEVINSNAIDLHVPDLSRPLRILFEGFDDLESVTARNHVVYDALTKIADGKEVVCDLTRPGPFYSKFQVYFGNCRVSDSGIDIGQALRDALLKTRAAVAPPHQAQVDLPDGDQSRVQVQRAHYRRK